MPGEHVEDQHRSVDDGKRHRLLQILALARTQLVEHEDQRRSGRERDLGDLARLAAADERGGIDGVAALNDASDDRRAGGIRKRLHLRDLDLDRTGQRVRLHGHDERALHQGDALASGLTRSTSQRRPAL